MMSEVLIREIQESDNLLLAKVIRSCFLDYDAEQEGTVFSSPVIERLYQSFSGINSKYFVLDRDGEVLGGAGIQALKGADEDICELQKMYIRAELRGQGFGKALLDKCLEFARGEGFRICYLESLPELKDALKMYERAGFQYIPERLGDTGYYGCSLFMTLRL